MPDGRLLTPGDRQLPSVAESRELYQSICVLLSHGMEPLFDWVEAGHVELYPLIAQVFPEQIAFDELCGHWLCGWRPHIANDYCYRSVVLDGLRRNIGMHVLMYLAFCGEIPTYWNVKLEKYVSLSVDHLCMIKTCCNPLHLEVKTQGDNTKAARMYYQRFFNFKMGQLELFDPHAAE